MATDERDNTMEEVACHGCPGMERITAELTRLRAQVAERDADLAALVPLARDVIQYGGDQVPWDIDAARAALARVEARHG
jgi:hypothetical protein